MFWSRLDFTELLGLAVCSETEVCDEGNDHLLVCDESVVCDDCFLRDAMGWWFAMEISGLLYQQAVCYTNKWFAIPTNGLLYKKRFALKLSG